MTDDKKKSGGGAVCKGYEHWRGEMSAIIKELDSKMALVVSAVEAMRRECSKKHCIIEHRLTAAEHNGKSLTGRMAGLTKILIGSVILIVGAAAAAVLLK